MAQDVVTGFLDGEQAHGRPVGLAIDGTGALLIADDAGNTVWRVASADGSVTDEPVSSDPIANPVAESGAAEPAPGTAVEPSQTDIAPAVGPQDGATPPAENTN